MIYVLSELQFSESMMNDTISVESEISYANAFCKSFTLYQDFITPVEESNLVIEVDPHLKRQVYEKDHWDDVRIITLNIHNFNHFA